ncbi:hypothetical protein HPB47_002096 [Ixodes persulcatus]|uniref:Uncharacterized protein n=1 Tax=Ixodes persulcatus TaxID=34615 RepID=A0AC60PM56_IXOPE|nr:hypothetical protein HPB47_002096 [Ixodes persulcatus]
MTKDGKEQSEYVKAIDDLRREIRAEMHGLKESVKYSSDIYDEVKAITAELKGLRKEVKQLTESNRNLQVENKALTLKVDELEQYQRANNLEVKGVPLEGDPSEIVKKLCEVLGEPVLDSDIDICHRENLGKKDFLPNSIFLRNVADLFVDFLTMFQRSESLLHVSYQEMVSLVKKIFGRSLRVEVYRDLTGEELKSLDVERSANWKQAVEAGGDTETAISDWTAEEKTLFRLGARSFYMKAVIYLISKLPLTMLC